MKQKILAILLRSGALPVKINVLEVRTVGPSLGQDSKDKSVVAFGAGIAIDHGILTFALSFIRLCCQCSIACICYVITSRVR